MSIVLRPGLGVLYMKVGTHAAEPLDEIIKRKTKEIEEAGFAMWGYGGNSCHPRTMVQPFARTFEQHGDRIYLCMQEMNSNNFAAQVRADEWSANGFGWHEIPPQINVLGHVTPCASRICTKRSLDYRFQQPALRWGIALEL